MKFGNINNFVRSWIVGDFEPSLFKTKSNDIGILRVNKGDKSDGHFHKKHIEYNIMTKFDLRYLSKQSKKLKEKGFKIGLCHGVFDIIHAGHISHFSEVKKKSALPSFKLGCFCRTGKFAAT